MKVAVQISGAPRFCSEFDLFLNSLSNYTSIDWFFYLWKESIFPDVGNRDLVPPFWRLIQSREWASEKIQNNLPNNNYLRVLELGDQNDFVFSTSVNRPAETHVDSVWKMFSGIHKVNQIRIDYEKTHGMYDLVIRARNDVGILGTLNLEKIYNRCKENPKIILISNNHKHGQLSLKLNDMFAISLPNNITTYCDLVNNIVNYNQAVPFHPETLLGHHLTSNGLQIENGGFDVVLREQGRVVNNRYTSNFGRWN